MPPKLNGMFYDEKTGRYFAKPRGGGQISGTTESTQYLQRKMNEEHQTNFTNPRFNKDNDKFHADVILNRDMTNKTLGDYTASLNEDPKLLKLRTLMSPKLRGVVNLGTASMIHKANTLAIINVLTFDRTTTTHLLYRIDGILLRPKFIDEGFIDELELSKPEIRSTVNYIIDEMGELDYYHEYRESKHVDLEFIIENGFSASNKLIERPILAEWEHLNMLNKRKNSFISGDEIINSDITFLYQCANFRCTGFRDGTVLIKYIDSPGVQGILKTGSSVCCVKFIFSNEYTVCIVSGINHSLKSYKYNDISMRWIPFLSYTGYINRAKLSENLKVASIPSCINRNLPQDRLFAVESFDDLLQRNIILFYDFTKDCPVRTNEIPIDFNNNSYAQWSIVDTTFLFLNQGQRDLETYKICLN